MGSSRMSSAGASRVISARASRARSPPRACRPESSLCRRRHRSGRAGLAPQLASLPLIARVIAPSGVSRPDNSSTWVLAEIADLILPRRELRRPSARAVGEQAGKRRLAVAVAAEQRDAIVGIDAQVQPAQHRRVRGIAHSRHIQGNQRRFEFAWGREVEAQARVVGERGDRLHLGQHLGAALGLFGGGGASAVAGDISGAAARGSRRIRRRNRARARRAASSHPS